MSSSPAGRQKLEIEYEPLSEDLFEVKLVGELGMGSVNSLDRVLKAIFELGVYRIIVNLEETTYIASSGIGVLLASNEVARENGGELVFVAMTPKVRQVFKLMGLGNSLRYADTSKEALKLLKKSK
jgi:anti-sigma B factor antagonist